VDVIVMVNDYWQDPPFKLHAQLTEKTIQYRYTNFQLATYLPVPQAQLQEVEWQASRREIAYLPVTGAIRTLALGLEDGGALDILFISGMSC
jgi:hypothetical protein